MEHAAWTFDTSDIPWILQNLLFPHTSFWWENFLHISNQRHASFDTCDITNYIEITQSIMPKPIYLLTVQEAHKEYNSLMDQIRAKYEQLDSGEYGTVGTPVSNAEA